MNKPSATWPYLFVVVIGLLVAVSGFMPWWLAVIALVVVAIAATGLRR